MLLLLLNQQVREQPRGAHKQIIFKKLQKPTNQTGLGSTLPRAWRKIKEGREGGRKGRTQPRAGRHHPGRHLMPNARHQQQWRRGTVRKACRKSRTASPPRTDTHRTQGKGAHRGSWERARPAHRGVPGCTLHRNPHPWKGWKCNSPQK